MDVAEQWEPDEARASRPVLRARGGETPLGRAPSRTCVWHEEEAHAEKIALADHLPPDNRPRVLRPEKTRITAVTDGFEFLGFHVTMHWDKLTAIARLS